MSFLRFRSSDSFINSPPRPATDDNDFNLFLLHRVCSQPALLLPADSLRALQFSLSLPFNIFHLIRTTMAGIETPQPLGRGCGVVWNSSPTKESQQPALRLTCNHFLIRFFTPNHPRNLTSSSSSSLTDTGTQTLRGRGRV